jgi:tetratricopeptide (TPR) repeat protein
MTPELWERLKPLFHAAMERDGETRASFVQQACGADAELKRHLLQLIQTEQDGMRPFDFPIVNLSSASNLVERPFRPGEIVLGRFRIIRLLGRGGMGEVFEADDLELGRIALKTIRPDLSTSTPALDRFRREVQLARKITGPHVCRIHELFVLPAIGGNAATAFLTMEYLDGFTLASRIKQSGPLPRKDALPIALDICEGLRSIHHKSIVHRDLKSANIMLCRRDNQVRAVVMDFGLARDGMRDALPSDGSTASVVSLGSGSGVIAGTPAYMAPEQFEGKPVSAATDIYALGVVLYEMITGLHPYEADTPVGAAIRRARRRAPASSVQHRIPRHWDRVIERCLEYDPEQRYQSAEEVANALKASPVSPTNLRRDYPWLVPVFAVAALAAVVWGATVWWQWRQYYRPSAEGQRWYNAGVAALREGSYLKATRALENATRGDSRFVMAHARLAEAWSNLDFDGTAQREMLIATSGEGHLPPLDREYLNAIRATLTRDFKSALAIYQEILDRLPKSEKQAGYVDLGMAYERASDPQHALQSYGKASTLNPDNPAPYLRAGMLESRLNQVPQANRDFGHAQSLYTSEMNPEGLAELDYQRGYLANQREANDEANTYLNHALSEAQRLPSVQLEIRALTQLSSVAYHSAHDDEAVALAQRAIQLARDNQLEPWAADGFVRLANVKLYHDYSQADEALQQAFRILQQNQQTRVEAMANLTLASLRNQQERFKDVLAPATAALTYYQAHGHFFEAARASLLIARAQRSTGHLPQALESGNALLELARTAGLQDFQTQAEELLGSIYLRGEDYPRALDHFQHAFSLAGEGIYRPYEALNCAELLTRLGSFAEAAQMLALVPPLNASAGEIRAELLLNEGKNAQAAALANTLLQSPVLSAGRIRDLRVFRDVASAHRGNDEAVEADIRSILGQVSPSADPGDLADLDLSSAIIELKAGDSRTAYQAASAAEIYFGSQNMHDSALRSSLLAARAAKDLHDELNQKLFTGKAVDIQSKLRQTWDPQLFHSYITRPDLRALAVGITIPPG